MRELLAAFVLVLLLWIMEESGTMALDVCQTTPGDLFGDCGRYDAPSGKNRVCSVDSSSGSVHWYTVTLESRGCRQSSTAQDTSLVCPGYVGMNMSLLCDFPDVAESVMIYKDGMLLVGEPTVTFRNLQKEDEGLYQCILKNGSLEVIAEFNMTVRSEVHIGGAGGRECAPFHCDVTPLTERKCCYYNIWAPRDNDEQRRSNPMSLRVYGEPPINYTLSVEWVTERADHYPTDLGPYIETHSTDPTAWDLNFLYYPHNVNRNPLFVVIVVTASNNISSFSTCILPRLTRTSVYTANTSLPHDTNTTVGGNASFFCAFGSNKQNSFINLPRLRFKLSIPGDDDHNSSVLSTVCQNWDMCDDWSPAFPTTELSIRPIEKFNEPTFVFYQYEVRLSNVAQELSGSQFSCSISTDIREDSIQWEGTAELIVERNFIDFPDSLPRRPTTPGVSTTAETQISTVVLVSGSSAVSSGAITATALTLVVIILGLVTAISLLFAALVRWRRKHSLPSYELASVPLSALSDSPASQSPVSRVAETTITATVEQPALFSVISNAAAQQSATLPSIAVIEVNEARRDVNVRRDVLHETRSMDSGVSCTEDYEHLRRPPPSTLQIAGTRCEKIPESTSPIRLCRSESDLVDSPSMADARQSSPRRRSVVYISYTESTSRWVRTSLKPLIDSWNVADVMLPERDMVAGKAVSNERRRLIVEADKIIVVVSPDYYESDWCSYELMHAIQNEPTLSRGRIIPILIDGCTSLPKNMEVVVPLLAHAQNFSQRLLAAIHPHAVVAARLSLQ